MLSWGELWDKKIELSSRVSFAVTSVELDAEKDKIKTLIDGSSLDDLYELEVRVQALLHGVIATPEQIKEGSGFLENKFFPDLNDYLTASGNTCHDEAGRFCETHNTIHNNKNMSDQQQLDAIDAMHSKGHTVKEISSAVGLPENEVKSLLPVGATPNGEKTGWLAKSLDSVLSEVKEIKENYAKPFPTSTASPRPTPKPTPAQAPAQTIAMVPQKVALPGKMFGGQKYASQAQINDEIKLIKKLADKSEKSVWLGGGGLHDRIEASTRSTALVAGRIASKKEVENAYHAHQRSVATGMLMGGLVVHHFMK